VAAHHQRQGRDIAEVGSYFAPFFIFSISCQAQRPYCRSHPSGSQNQAAALRAEGVEVTAGAMGELMVDLAEYGWFPEALPSEAGASGGEDEES